MDNVCDGCKLASKNLNHYFWQGSQFCTILAGVANIYCTGQCTGIDTPFVLYQKKKYRSYQPRTSRAGEIQLFRPVNGY